MTMHTTALENYLEPLEPYLYDTHISEILINRPQEVSIERSGNFETLTIKELTYNHLMGLVTLIARYTNQQLNEKTPLLSGQLPQGYRVQIVIPPATSAGQVVLAIRKQTIESLTLEDYENMGMFHSTQAIYNEGIVKNKISNSIDAYLLSLFKNQHFMLFLKEAIRHKKNILISGATSTGKTTFLNACLKEIPAHEHIVTLEDVPEVKPPHKLHTPLFASKGQQGLSSIRMQDLVQASLRLRPDRIILGELRGEEAADFINATATGHDGSLSSVHAASPETAFMRLTHMVKLSVTNLSKEDVLSDLHTVIDIVVQLQKEMINHQLQRKVTSIYYEKAYKN